MYIYKKKKIGLFGGSFNPPHQAHIELTKYSIKALKLDLLVFIPAYKSVDKLSEKYLPASERVKMLELSRPKKNTVISFLEINLGKAIQSIETVRHFKDLFRESQIYFLFGDDHIPTLYTWQYIKELFTLSVPVIFRRVKNVDVNQLKVLVGEDLFKKVIFLNNRYFPHSSTSFRANLNLKLLHKNVQKYLKNNPIR